MLSPRVIGIALTWISLGFVALGYSLPWAFHHPAFNLYRNALIGWIGSGGGSHEANKALQVGLGILGGSIAGKWTMHGAIAWFGIRRRETWAVRATWGGLLGWFAVDSLASWRLGAHFNIWMINLMPLVAVIPLLLLIDSKALSAYERSPGPKEQVAAWVCGILVLAGLVVAFGANTFLFAPWWDQTGLELFGGPMPHDARRALVFCFGPIGGCIVANYVLFAWSARCGSEQPWVWRAILVSLLAWFLFDSTMCWTQGARFNVLSVNLGTVIATLPATFLLRRASTKG